MSLTYGEEEPIHDGKLVVHIAENGHSFELECNGTTLVEAVMQFIESVSGVYFNDQLVLCADMKLEPQHLLSSYKLPSNDREVFIFNKARLQVHSSPPPPEEIEVIGIADPPLPSSSDDPHPLDDASDPALKALPSYERQFRYHFNLGRVIYSRTQVRIQTIDRLLREIKVQERAVEVARSNLEQYYRLINQNYLEFMKRYLQQYRVHSDLLVNFGRDIERLQLVSLHPSLQTGNRKCLLDLWKEDNLRKLAENRTNSHRQFENKVLQFKQTFGEMKRKVEDLFSSKGSLPVRNLEQKIQEHQRYINEQKSILQSLSKDVNTVKKLVDDCLSSQQLSSSLRPHDAVSALGPMYEGHEKNHLPRMQACDHLTSELLDLCKDQKNEMNLFVHNYVKKITHVSYTIKDIKLQFPVFKEAMARQDDQFVELRLVRGIGPAYRACLAEVIRRKASMKLYMGMAGQLAERLAMKREAEIRRREEFLKAQSLYVPKEILASMGLFDVPSQCVVNVAPFDTALLDIEISGLDQYAPEYLVGPYMKAERQGSLKGSFSMSNDGSQAAESEDFALGTLHNSLDFFEENELVEIAGTGKLEVENAKLKAELASAIALICSLHHEIEYESLDKSKLDATYKNITEKTAEALHLKDEHSKHLESMLKKKQMQCVSYEKRIQELEQKLSNHYSQEQKLSTSKVALESTPSGAEIDERKAHMSEGFEHPLLCISPTESMDEVSCISSSLDPKFSTRQLSKSREGVDENMLDSSSLLNPHLDTSMQEPQREQQHVTDEDGKDKMVAQLGLSSGSSVAETVHEPSHVHPSDAITKSGVDIEPTNDLLSELECAIADKSNQLSETEAKLKAAIEELAGLRRELEVRQKLLDESQMNCAHLENCLHEARQEAQTHLCAAERRASEYNALRATTVKMHGLIERFRSCLYASGGVTGFADSWRNLAQSLSSPGNEDENDATAEFRQCIKVLADRIVLLSAFRQELFEKDKKLENEKEGLRKELIEKEEMIKTLYKKHQLEKQANKEKISFGRLEVHEIAAFVQNSAGHYEAINRNSRNYYLSAESVALFVDRLPTRPSYIIGRIVHIECQVVKASPPNQQEQARADKHEHTSFDKETNRLTLNSGSSSNPYGLPIGCEYFLVTVAMLPNAKIHSPPS